MDSHGSGPLRGCLKHAGMTILGHCEERSDEAISFVLNTTFRKNRQKLRRTEREKFCLFESRLAGMSFRILVREPLNFQIFPVSLDFLANSAATDTFFCIKAKEQKNNDIRDDKNMDPHQKHVGMTRTSHCEERSDVAIYISPVIPLWTGGIQASWI